MAMDPDPTRQLAKITSWKRSSGVPRCMGKATTPTNSLSLSLTLGLYL